MRTRTDYTGIRNALAALTAARAELNRLCSLNIGVISGGIDTAEEREEFDRCCSDLESRVRAAIDGGCRLSQLQAICGDETAVKTLIADAIEEQRFQRELAQQR